MPQCSLYSNDLDDNYSNFHESIYYNSDYDDGGSFSYDDGSFNDKYYYESSFNNFHQNNGNFDVVSSYCYNNQNGARIPSLSRPLNSRFSNSFCEAGMFLRFCQI